MSLEVKIVDGMKEAMKAKDKVKLDAYRAIKTAIMEFKTSGVGRDITAEDEMKILKTQAKRRRDAIDMYEKAGRTELLEKEKQELEVIESFLPKQLSEEEIIPVVKDIVTKTGAAGPSDMGKVMGMSMKELKDKADGSLVQKVVKNILGNM